MELSIEQNLINRLIVITTDCLAVNNHLAHSIHWMAERENVSVLYFVVVENRENMLAVSRSMTTMKAVTSANRLQVEVKVAEADRWFETLRKVINAGDVILCQEEQTVFNGSYKAIPMSNFLSSHLSFPVRTISGYTHPLQNPEKKRLHGVFALLGFLLIMALFTFLQINLERLFDGSLAKIFITITFFIEVGAIWSWYKFSNL